MNKPAPAYNDPRPRCEPKPPFWKACNLITDCGQPECPRHIALRTAAAGRKAAKSVAARAANTAAREKRQA